MKQSNRNNDFWKHPKVIAYFAKLCSVSEEKRINWKTFRKKDKKGIFNKFGNSYLSQKAMIIQRKSDGLCIKCGKTKNLFKSSMCQSCYKQQIGYASQKYHRKEDDD